MRRILIAGVLLCCMCSAQAQQDTSLATGHEACMLGSTHTIWSRALGEKRTMNVYVPDGYHKDRSKTYPVIYLLDGSANEDFIHVCGIVQFLCMIEAMPPTVVVGIANADRRRDFTFPTTVTKDKADFPTTGGSAKFIEFLERELLPMVHKAYRVEQRTATIVGQSLGGLLATEVLLVISQMPAWKPGLQNGEPVKVVYHLPVRFGLE